MNYLTSDLDIVAYRGKWKDAKRLASLSHGSRRDGYYWQAVRECFLALGGGFKEQS